MQIDEITRNANPRKLKSSTNYTGWILCAAAVLMFLCVAFDAAAFVSNIIYGIFGWYSYVGFALLFMAGLLMGLHKKVVVRRRFVVWSCLMLFALFTGSIDFNIMLLVDLLLGIVVGVIAGVVTVNIKKEN